MTVTSERRLLVTSPDVASLARVRRPVVSVWRSRFAASEQPFPQPVSRAGAQVLFDLDAVVEWLVATGRGNNPQVREEGALFAALDALGEGERGKVLDGLTALLALKVRAGVALAELSAADLRDLADEVDPHDRLLYREIAALGGDAVWWAGHADAVSNAAYTAAEAFEAVVAQRHRLGLREQADAALDPRVVRLAARLATALVDPDRRAVTPVVDASGGSDLLVALCTALREGDLPPISVRGSDSSAGRLARRRLLVHGWDATEIEPGDDANWPFPPGALILAQLPGPVFPTTIDRDALATVDEMALSMADQRAVVIAPAGALVNRTWDHDVTAVRSTLVRSGKVRAAVRLPAGLWLAQPRRQLALWVLGPEQTDRPVDDRWTAVADLSREDLTDDAVEDLVTDVVAAMGTAADVRSHAFRFARVTRTSRLAAASGDITALGADVGRSGARVIGAELAVTVQSLVDIADRPVRGGVGIEVEHHERSSVLSVTLEELLASGAARVVAGNRIDLAHLVMGDGVPVIGAEEVMAGQPRSGRSLDRLTFAAAYPAGRYTQPGDVVFCTTPAVGALVDDAGFSVAASPARVLRLDRAVEPRLSPAAVAQAMRSAPADTGWRRRRVALPPQAQVSPLEGALQRLGAARVDAEARLRALDRLAAMLPDAVASGALTINLTPARADDSAEQEG